MGGRPPSGKNGVYIYARGKHGQHRTQRRKPCAGRRLGTETVQMSLPTCCFQTNAARSTPHEFALHQKEVCAN